LLNDSTNINLAYDVFVTKYAPGGTSLIYSTLLGSTNSDIGNQIAVDAFGNAYVAGSTVSYKFPDTVTNVPGLSSYLVTNNQSSTLFTNAFLARITWNGTNAAIGYSAVFGGQGNDVAYALAVDPAGNAFVVGRATSGNFPTVNTNGYLRGINSGGSDAFITAFKTNGTALFYSAYLGGNANDVAYGVAVDPMDNAYIVGQTSSGNFPTTNAAQSKLNGSGDAFLAKILLMSAEPTLAIAPASPNIVLSKSAYLPEYQLESNTNLLFTNGWKVVPVPPPLVISNGLQFITLPATNNDLFFRLHKP
jgi:hypothetical protein